MKSVTSWFKRLSSSDQRAAQRTKSPLLVAYYWDGAAPMAHAIEDISSTGFYLITKERWPLGTIVTMMLQRTDVAHGNSGVERCIVMLSIVVRLGKDGVGFAFIPLEAPSKTVKNGPAGKKALIKFLEQFKLDQGVAALGYIQVMLKAKLSRQNSGSAIPEKERYEETER